MLKHFFWDYFKESGDIEAYMIYKQYEFMEVSNNLIQKNETITGTNYNDI